jgi:hypothetical protein
MSLGGGGADDNNCGNSNTTRFTGRSVARWRASTWWRRALNADFAGFVPAARTTGAHRDGDGRQRPAGRQRGGDLPRGCGRDARRLNFATLAADRTIRSPRPVSINSTWKGGGYNDLQRDWPRPRRGTAALCLAGGVAGMSPSQVISKLRGDAAGQPAWIHGRPTFAVGNRYYGYLVHAGAISWSRRRLPRAPDVRAPSFIYCLREGPMTLSPRSAPCSPPPAP